MDKYEDKILEILKNQNLAYPINIIQVAAENGIKVFTGTMNENTSGMILISPNPIDNYGTNKLILVNYNDCDARQRFSIAHELAHYFLHYKGTEYFANRSINGVISKEEKEADIFAAELLMPYNSVKNEFYNYTRNCSSKLITHDMIINNIKNKFLVSFDAARIRLEKLRLL